MLFVSAVNVALGWGWHIAYRAKHHWSLKREGALIAAAAVALIGTVDALRSAHRPQDHGAPAMSSPILAPTAALTDSATPVVTAAQPLEIQPTDQAPETVAATQPPAVPPMPAASADDAIGQKILERLGDPVATGSIAPAAPADGPEELDPVDAATLVKPEPPAPAPAKPAKATKPAKVTERHKKKTEP
ncbi:hypothetical protein [Labrys wisconsinensis]|uniref:Uncharacterized protein n=1 Tax=Labrys wisconsinensis TaxID=425677 RepID=A0ABU0J5V1_9HYPH|nr:hypothetical protein [Labrys wisconsinensis]MDQ0469020.1 hypothetical protein [Labrys wisconsinensis]